MLYYMMLQKDAQQRWICMKMTRKWFLANACDFIDVRLTVTPYLSAIPCSVSPSVTRCSMYVSPNGAVTLAVLPYERVFVRAKLCDNSLSDSEPDRDLGNSGGPYRPPPPSSRNGGSTGENSAIFNPLLLELPWRAKTNISQLTRYYYSCFHRHTSSSAFLAVIFRGSSRCVWFSPSPLSLLQACASRFSRLQIECDVSSQSTNQPICSSVASSSVSATVQTLWGLFFFI